MSKTEICEIELIFDEGIEKDEKSVVVKKPRGRPRKVYTQEEIETQLEKRRLLNARRNEERRQEKLLKKNLQI